MRLLEKVVHIHKELSVHDEKMSDAYSKGLVEGFSKASLNQTIVIKVSRMLWPAAQTEPVNPNGFGSQGAKRIFATPSITREGCAQLNRRPSLVGCSLD